MFFRNWNKREEIISEDSLENSNDLWADSVTTGLEYTCNLSLTTPRICIENDGFITNDTSVKTKLIGEPNNLGKDGDPSRNFGYWLRRHGHEEEFEELANISKNMIYVRPSDIGRIPSKSKLEKDFRIREAADLVIEGLAFSSITSYMSEKYTISRRQARRIAVDAYKVISSDIEESDLDRKEMTSKLVCLLENTMHLAMKEKQYSAVASNAKVLMKLVGLEAK